MDAQVSTIIRCIVDAVDSMQGPGYENEVNSFHTMDEELRLVMNSVDQHKGKIVGDFEAQMRQLREIRRRVGELSSDEGVISAQRKCREISKESLDSQLDKSEDLMIFLNSKQKYFNDMLHLKLTGLNNTLLRLDKQQEELLRLEHEVIPEQVRKVEKLGKRVNKTAMAALVGGGGPRMDSYENPEIINLKETLKETQREKDELSDKVSIRILRNCV